MMSSNLDRKSASKSVVIFGNGSTRLGDDGRAFVNQHTANFVQDLVDDGIEVAFVQPCLKLESGATLSDGVLNQNGVEVLNASVANPIGLIKVFWRLRKASIGYFFFPGRWSRLFASVCLLIGKPYGVYLRGEKFAEVGQDAKILRRAKFVCTVAGLEKRVERIGGNPVPIAPMLDQLPAFVTGERRPRIFGGKLKLLFVGRIEEAKGVSELLAAAEILRQEGLDFQLKLIGGGPLLNDLRVRHSGTFNVKFEGLVSDRYQLMEEFSNSDILVLPTHHEGFPRVLYEAMSNACAIITTFVGGISSIMKHRENCLEISVKDENSIASAVRLLASQPNLLAQLGEAGHKTLLEVIEKRPKHSCAVRKALNG